MSETGITVNMRRFRGDVERFRRESRQTFRDVMRSQMGLWAEDLMKSYPPASKGPMRGGKGSPRAVGNKAVEAGVSEVAMPVIMGSVSKARPFEGHMIYQNPETQAVWLIENGNWDPGASESTIRTRHRAAKRNRKGKPPRSHNGEYKSFTVVDKLHVKRATYRKYLRNAKKSVGKLKSGWVRGMTTWGRKAPAGWISNHAARTGSITQRYGSTNIDLRMTNKNTWASQYPGVVNFTLRTRSRDLEKQAIKRLNKDIRRENQRSKMKGVA